MWYLLIFIGIVVALPTGLASVPLYALENAISQFVMLGIIPGTNISITLDWFIAGFWIVFFYWLLTKLTFPLLEKLRMHRKITHINRISL